MKVYVVTYTQYSPDHITKILGVELTPDMAVAKAQDSRKWYAEPNIPIVFCQKDYDDFKYYDKQQAHVAIIDYETSEAV